MNGTPLQAALRSVPSPTQTLFRASTVRPNSRAPQPHPRPGNTTGPHGFSARGPT